MMPKMTANPELQRQREGFANPSNGSHPSCTGPAESWELPMDGYPAYPLKENLWLQATQVLWTPEGLRATVRLFDGPLTEEEARFAGPDADYSATELGAFLVTRIQDCLLLARLLREIFRAEDDGGWLNRLPLNCIHFFNAIKVQERAQQQPIMLIRAKPAAADPTINVGGWHLLEHNHTLLFGNGGTSKSFLSLWAAGELATAHRKRVLFLDWELSAGEHGKRLRDLFPTHLLNTLFYRQCSGPLTSMIGMLKDYCSEESIDYLVLDSVGFAISGEPTEAGNALSYFGALKDIGVPGTLSIAHVTKTLPKNQTPMPFGSVFWHNGARATWQVHDAEQVDGTANQTVKLTPWKRNLTGELPCLEAELCFEPGAAKVTIIDSGRRKETPKAEAKKKAMSGARPITLRTQVAEYLAEAGTGATEVDIKKALGATADALRKMLQRDEGKTFVKANGLISLVNEEDMGQGHVPASVVN